MDLNIPATTTVANDNQENNQLLLNAIKSKFAAQTSTEALSFSPPKFNIPLLKVPVGTNSVNNSNTTKSSRYGSDTQLNKFLFKQLQEKHTNNGLSEESTEIVLPQLQSSESSKLAGKFESPLCKPTNVSTLTTAITKLQVQENSSLAEGKRVLTTTANIDLTTALASKLQIHQGTPPTRDFVKPQQNSEEFDIPFIDCDRLDVTKKHELFLQTSNEYCVTDISKLLLQHTFVDPSAIGRCLCMDDVQNKYLAPLPLKYLTPEYRQQKAKHHIEPFIFETKSPDDLVLEALSKYQRRHCS